MYALGRNPNSTVLSPLGEAFSAQQDIAGLWGKNSEKLFRYENLPALAVQNDIVQLEQNGAFFVLRRPLRTDNSPPENRHTLGWKLHVSIDPSQLKEAFNLVASLIGQYCLCFKVTHPEKVQGERYKKGAQITIYLEEQGRPVVTASDAQNMIKEIDQLFLKNKIKPGIRPESDAETISPYVSMRNDKNKFMLNSATVTYCSWQSFGKNFNPANNPNPFSQILNTDATSFDVLTHFQSCQKEGAENNELTQMHFYLTLFAYLREHTVWDDMSNPLQEKFMFQYCVQNGNNFDQQFLKKEYQTNPEILLAVKQAFYMVFVYEVNSLILKNVNYHHYIHFAQLSAQYPYDNSFRKLILAFEAYAKESVKTDPPKKQNSIFSLIDFWARLAEKTIDRLSVDELINSIPKEGFYYVQAALKQLRLQCNQQEYLKILHSNETIPAVQVELARIYKSKLPEMSESFLLKAILSKSVNCIQIDPNKIAVLLKHHDLEQLQGLSKSGNSLATFALAMIYAQDAVNPKNLAGFEKFSNIPADYVLTKEYLSKLNGIYAEEARMLTQLIG